MMTVKAAAGVADRLQVRQYAIVLNEHEQRPPQS
jgi:hypothetical protein